MFWEILEAECRKQGKLPTPFVKSLGISSGTLENWKKGGEVRSGTLIKLSKALNVSIDYLLTGKPFISQEDPPLINRNEEMLLTMYRHLSEQQKGKCYAYIQGMHDAADSGEKSAAV